MTFPTIIAAPMAGGPSTPALVRAVARAGGLGFLPSGNISADQLARDMADVGDVEYGVNFFFPQPFHPAVEDVEAVRGRLELFLDEVPEAVTPDFSNQFEEKWEVVLANPPKVVSTSFGCFTPAQIDEAHAAGIEAWVSVTSVEEAEAARGADALIVQGYEAGGHRLTWDAAAEPNHLSVEELLPLVAERVSVPLIAAGGVRTAEDVRRLVAAGAAAVSCGSVFLLSDEAGTSEFNRSLLLKGGATVSSRAFSGRYARGLRTELTDALGDLPPVYPYLSALTKSLRGTEAGAYCLTGDTRGIPTGSAEDIVYSLSI